MTDSPDPPAAPTPAAASPDLHASRRWNLVWVVPILAIVIGGWLIYHSLASEGPTVRLKFDTADGIAVGKTEVRCRSVRVGIVDDVELSKDLNSVMVSIRIDPEAARLLREGTRWWVVRPRVSGADISGLGTLITGAYIELDPGTGREGITDFDGLETPPATSRSVPGRRLTLLADEAGSLVAGSPIYYRGFEVGRIESRRFDIATERVVYEAFIRQEYAGLVKENTRFWNTSGVDISAGASGFRVRTPSIQAMLSGGATFGTPEGIDAGQPVVDGSTFQLYPGQDEAESSTFRPTLKFLLLFDQSVRGLSKGAPVEFRGIPIGRVADISLSYTPAEGARQIPVLVEIDPALLRSENAIKLSDPQSTYLADAVGRGLRAALKTGSLLTGALYVDMDYYPDATAAQLAKVGEYTTIPTVSSGLAQLEAKVSAILDKIQSLPLDQTLAKFGNAADESSKTIAEMRSSLDEIKAVAASANDLLSDPNFKSLPEDLRKTLGELQGTVASVGPDGSIQGDLLRTLDELRASLRSFKALTTTIDDKPSSLLFGRDSSGNPIPKAPKR